MTVQMGKFVTSFISTMTRVKKRNRMLKRWLADGPSTISNATSKWCFQRFRSGHMNIEDEVRSDRLIVGNVDIIMEIATSDKEGILTTDPTKAADRLESSR